MAILPVLTFPNQHLKKTSKNITKVDSRIQELAHDMLETMYQENGIGLAAPQIDERLRLIVVDVPKPDPIDPEKFTSDSLILINPQITSGSGIIEYEEGCLSCPDLLVKVERQDTIQVHYLDINGKPSEVEASGLKAVCIQHEIDHLDGVLLVDRVGRLERNLYRKKRVKLAKETNQPKL